MARKIKSTQNAHGSGRRSRWPWHLFPALLICAGVLLILFTAGVKLYTAYRQDELLNRYHDELSRPPGSETSAPAPGDVSQWLTEHGELLPNPDRLSESSSDEDVPILGILEIPKLNLRVAVKEGVTQETLRYSVGHFTGTALPGEAGNCAITGHRSYLWGEFFNRLDELGHGDKLILERKGVTYVYVVMDQLVVEPEEVWVLDQGEDQALTLITCTPIRSGTHRLVVKAVLE